MINVAAGTYDEQVVVDGKNLTIQGAGDTTVIRPSAPSKLSALYTYPSGVLSSWVGVKLAPVILVENSGNVTVSHLKIDGTNVTSLPAGAARFSGILFGEAGGSVSNVTLDSIKTAGYADRTYVIDASATGGAKSVEIAHNTISDYARTAIQVQGADMTANIHDNTITGPGTIGPENVPNGIVFIEDAVGNATNNVIHALHYSGTDGSESTGLMAYQTTAGAGVTFKNNEVYDSDEGIIFALNAEHITADHNNFHNNGVVGIQVESNAANNTIINNTIANNSVAGIRLDGVNSPDSNLQDTIGSGNVANNKNAIFGNGVNVLSYDTNTFDATNNWWGVAASSSIAGLVSGDVNFDPYYTNAAMTSLSDDTATDATYASPTEGQADLPAGATEVVLTDTTVLDLSNAKTSEPSTDVVVGGNTVTLTQSVILQSGVDGDPVILTNSNLDKVSASIPDGTKIR